MRSTFDRTIVTLFPETGKDWLAKLPALIARCEQRWGMTVLSPLKELSFNYIAPAIRRGWRLTQRAFAQTVLSAWWCIETVWVIGVRPSNWRKLWRQSYDFR